MSVVDPETGYQETRGVYTSGDEVNDLAFIISQMTAGFKGALPEQDDFEIAAVLRDRARELIDDFYDT